MVKFVIKEKTKLFSGKFLSVWQTEFLDKVGNTKYWEWVERHNTAFIFPITRDQKAVLIKNYRVPLEKYVIEMPAGLIDKKGENELETAKRELLEETGYRAKNFIPLRPRGAALSRNLNFTFIATDLEKVEDHVEGDDTEDLEVIEVPLDGLLDFYHSLPEDILFSLDILAVAAIARQRGIK